MKKVTFIFLAYFAAVLISCCSDAANDYTAGTIETVGAKLFSMDVNGKIIDNDSLNINDFGIRVFADSISEEYITQSFSAVLADQAFACDNVGYIVVNDITTVSITTKFNFDSEHPAGSSVNDILNFGDRLLSDGLDNPRESYLFTFNAVPQNDSLQFEVSGTITDRGNFIASTELVVL